ncbi:hypothetical protein NDU88_002810 [Pleurodeles waltl]|uniref:Uncharacterized protein n=1 Tax=Pleurodeles waltl TaxID=8319 RepID=A0AAV7TPC7_PLEWA|nr:hypothetical protein NDU88_002810 [Pleurodeles waltl]
MADAPWAWGCSDEGVQCPLKLHWQDNEGTGSGLGQTWGLTALPIANRLRQGAEEGTPGPIFNWRQEDRAGRVHMWSSGRSGALVGRP